MPAPDAAPGILALADHDRLRNLFTGAGFLDPEIDEIAFTWRFPDSDAYWDFLTGAAGAVAMVVERLDRDERERVRAEVSEQAESFAGPEGLDLPAMSVVASAS